MKLFITALLLLATATDYATAEGKKYNPFSEKKSGKKAKKERKKRDDTLIANLGNPLGMGRVSFHFNPDDSMLVQINAVNQEAMCTADGECLLAINDGTCENVGEPFTTAEHEDAWSNGDNYYTLDANGFSRSSFVTTNGYGYRENRGKIVTLTDSSGAVWACSEIVEEDTENNVLTANMGVYPGYEGDFAPSGTVKVTFTYDNTFKFEFDLEGLEENCVDCGIHIHAGVSCETHEQVMGHGWNADFVRDLWLSKYGAVYNSDGRGKADSYFYLYNGWNLGINIGHAVVIHGQSGIRLGCGQLM